MEQVHQVFPDLDPDRLEQLRQLAALYREWNTRINVISRKDMDQLEAHHLLHSMLLAKVITFKAGSEVLDLGTGGGLPGLPLAILFPETRFHLIDGTGKKIRVVNEITEAMQLKNVTAQQVRAEELKRKFDFVVSRAVARLEKLVPWSRALLHHRHRHGLPNGLLCLKGGNLQEEIEALGKGEYVETFPLEKWVSDPYFKDKFAVYVQG